MTRRLLAFFAPSMLAAQIPNCVETKGKGPYIHPTIRLRNPPPNGECPIPGCGWKAGPFTKPYTDGFRYTDGTIYRRIDCAHCGCTFRQWADGKEPKR